MKKTLLLLLSSLFLLLSCSQKNSKNTNIFEALNGNEYYLTSNPKITIGFENCNVYGNASINRYFTSFTISNNQIILGTNIGATLMAGNEEDMKNESEFLSDLGKANSVSLDNDKLTIKTTENKELTFTKRSLNYNDLYGREFILENKYPEIGITIAFDTNKIYGFSGVNRYFGGYTLTNDNIITIGALGSTMMAGPEENMKAEQEFSKLISEASNITLSITNLEITTKSGEKLIFKDDSISSNKLLGRTFLLRNFYEYPNVEITMSFYGKDNQVNGFSGVNTYKTSYTNINGEIKFNGLAMTRMAGPEENMNAESDFSKYIENAKYMYLKGKELIIIDNNSKILRFVEDYFDVNEHAGKEFKLSNMFEGTEITLSITNNSFVGKSGVNNYNIPFEVKDGKITMSKTGISTLMAGPETDMKAEDEYLKLLNKANYISYNNNTLCLKTSDDDILLFNMVN
ncbi:META domain-containing protein [Brachyspira hyodysenteriae]|uniref:META domain-containing protein n=1 Tax=Brachyspira hyodysenteriae TaxID=159 RepID=UPI0022CD5A4E|nr:META domain-containing protein [Brachyspira hyodysenteriae]MCZ9852015.1 META domain-containing protein [Brachyspira hyodysenteriae]MCZ9861640.1 META domain-containing protein [Brachyspira hyodysenteriae]MCZ9868873.1 META domain-containing protein [Brachyspira hyodysenteriae]MCZ9875196.1 META domain-containing protein [Brachyspira hyodysenteriae]MCZ9877539.1 META domain-containing protein [Brachyspira hyodysenteriae]